MTPSATQLEFRLDQRRRWFENEWFFKWHHIGGQHTVEIDTFDGRLARYAGIRFEGSPRLVYWNALQRGVRKEIIEQFAWIEERVRSYARAPAEAAIDECARLLTAFAQSVYRSAIKTDRMLGGNNFGSHLEQENEISREGSFGDISHQAAALKAALFPPEEAVPSWATARTPTGRGKSTPAYQVALSFAGEQREYVDDVARCLQARGIAVFYDRFEAVTLWGKDGVEFFHQLFAAGSDFVVMFISKDYVAKKWTRHEGRSALGRAIAEEREYVLPVRFDDSAVPGLSETVQYLRAQDYSPAELAVMISQKIGVPPLTAEASEMPAPHVGSPSDDGPFDYNAIQPNGSPSFTGYTDELDGTGVSNAGRKRGNRLGAIFSSGQLSKTMSNPRYEDDLPRLDRHFDRGAIIKKETIIVAIGHSVINELLDRPVAEKLRDQIDQRGSGKEFPYRRAIVITDQGWYDEARHLGTNAVIALGSPRDNKLSAEFDKWVPVASSGEGKYTILGTQALTGFFRWNPNKLPQVALWGETARGTREAVEHYLQDEKGLSAFLKMVWK